MRTHEAVIYVTRLGDEVPLTVTGHYCHADGAVINDARTDDGRTVRLTPAEWATAESALLASAIAKHERAMGMANDAADEAALGR